MGLAEYYLYRHIRLDINQPFYIGIGKHRKPYSKYYRAFDVVKRSQYWKNIYNKTDYEVEILLDNLTKDEVILKEKEFIKLYGRVDNGTGILVNLTDGGESTVGYKSTAENIKLRAIKTSEALKGKKLSIERVAKMKERKGFKSEHKAKKVINILTNEVFNTIYEAANSINMKISTLEAQLRGQNKNKTNFKLLNN